MFSRISSSAPDTSCDVRFSEMILGGKFRGKRSLIRPSDLEERIRAKERDFADRCVVCGERTSERYGPDHRQYPKHRHCDQAEHCRRKLKQAIAANPSLARPKKPKKPTTESEPPKDPTGLAEKLRTVMVGEEIVERKYGPPPPRIDWTPNHWRTEPPEKQERPDPGAEFLRKSRESARKTPPKGPTEMEYLETVADIAMLYEKDGRWIVWRTKRNWFPRRYEQGWRKDEVIEAMRKHVGLEPIEPVDDKWGEDEVAREAPVEVEEDEQDDEDEQLVEDLEGNCEHCGEPNCPGDPATGEGCEHGPYDDQGDEDEPEAIGGSEPPGSVTRDLGPVDHGNEHGFSETVASPPPPEIKVDSVGGRPIKVRSAWQARTREPVDREQLLVGLLELRVELVRWAMGGDEDGLEALEKRIESLVSQVRGAS